MKVYNMRIYFVNILCTVQGLTDEWKRSKISDKSDRPENPDIETLQYHHLCGTAKQIVVYYVTVLKRRPRMFS